METEKTAASQAEDLNANSYLELEETLIPYPDSFDIQKSNETDYLLRVGRPFQYERLVLSSRFTTHDNEDYQTLQTRFAELVNWYHSTVYNFNDDVLEEENGLVFPTDIAASGAVFDQLHRNESAVRAHLLFNDIILVRDRCAYRYILERNSFILKGRCRETNLAECIIGADDLTCRSDEYLLLLSHPRRGAVVYGEKAYQASLLHAGELTQIIVAVASSQSKSLRVRKHSDCYDALLLAQIGLEGTGAVVAAVFEVHGVEA